MNPRNLTCKEIIQFQARKRELMFSSTRANNDCNCLFLGSVIANICGRLQTSFYGCRYGFTDAFEHSSKYWNFFFERMAVLWSYSKRREEELFYTGLMERDEYSRQTVMVMGKYAPIHCGSSVNSASTLEGLLHKGTKAIIQCGYLSSLQT